MFALALSLPVIPAGSSRDGDGATLERSVSVTTIGLSRVHAEDAVAATTGGQPRDRSANAAAVLTSRARPRHRSRVSATRRQWASPRHAVSASAGARPRFRPRHDAAASAGMRDRSRRQSLSRIHLGARYHSRSRSQARTRQRPRIKFSRARPRAGPFAKFQRDIQEKLSAGAAKFIEATENQADVTRKVAGHMDNYHQNVKGMAVTMHNVMKSQSDLANAYHRDVKEGESSRVGPLNLNLQKQLGDDIPLAP